MSKVTRVYELYLTPYGVSTYTAEYSKSPYKDIIHVAAKSIKQAYYLTANGIKFSNVSNTGILESIFNNRDKWISYDGSESYYPKYKHYQKLNVQATTYPS